MYLISFGLFLKENKLDIETWDYKLYISAEITKLMERDVDNYFGSCLE